MSSFTNKNGNAQPKLDGPNDLTPKVKTTFIIQKELLKQPQKNPNPNLKNNDPNYQAHPFRLLEIRCRKEPSNRFTNSLCS